MTRLENHIVLDDTMEFEKQMIHPSMEEQQVKLMKYCDLFYII